MTQAEIYSGSILMSSHLLINFPLIQELIPLHTKGTSLGVKPCDSLVPPQPPDDTLALR